MPSLLQGPVSKWIRVSSRSLAVSFLCFLLCYTGVARKGALETMNPRQRFEENIREYGRRIGESLEFDEDGSCYFELGEDRECLLSMPAESEVVVFCVNVTSVIMEHPEPLFRHLLIMNFTDEATRGTTLALTEGGDDIIIRYTRPADDLQVNDIEHLIGNMEAVAAALASALTEWQQNQVAGQAAASSEQGTDRDDEDGPPLQLPDYV